MAENDAIRRHLPPRPAPGGPAALSAPTAGSPAAAGPAGRGTPPGVGVTTPADPFSDAYPTRTPVSAPPARPAAPQAPRGRGPRPRPRGRRAGSRGRQVFPGARGEADR